MLGVVGDRHQRVIGPEVSGRRPRPVGQQARFPRGPHLVAVPPAHGRRPVDRGVDLVERAGGDHRRASRPDGQPVGNLLPCGQGEVAELVVVDTGTVLPADRRQAAGVTTTTRAAGPHGSHHPAGRREPHAAVEVGHEAGDRVPVGDGRGEVGEDVDRHAPGAVRRAIMPDGEEFAVPVRDHHPVLRVEVPVDPAEKRALGQLHLRQHCRGLRMEELDRRRERGGRVESQVGGAQGDRHAVGADEHGGAGRSGETRGDRGVRAGAAAGQRVGEGGVAVDGRRAGGAEAGRGGLLSVGRRGQRCADARGDHRRGKEDCESPGRRVHAEIPPLGAVPPLRVGSPDFAPPIWT